MGIGLAARQVSKKFKQDKDQIDTQNQRREPRLEDAEAGFGGDSFSGGFTRNKDGVGEVEFRSELNQAEFDRLNTPDGSNGQLRPGEADAAVRLQNTLGGQFERVPSGEGQPDFVITSGPRAG